MKTNKTLRNIVLTGALALGVAGCDKVELPKNTTQEMYERSADHLEEEIRKIAIINKIPKAYFKFSLGLIFSFSIRLKIKCLQEKQFLKSAKPMPNNTIQILFSGYLSKSLQYTKFLLK